MSRSRAISRACLRSEGGFALVEVMVSAVLLVVIGTATFNVIDDSAGRTSSNRARAAAVSLAEQDQDRMRAMPLTSLENFNQTREQTFNGVRFTIVSKSQYASDSSGFVACESSTGGSQFLVINTTVTWPDMNGIDPVKVDSVVSPNVANATNRGSVVVVINKANGSGHQGIAVTVAGTTKTTDAAGCAMWQNVPTGQSTITFGNSGGTYLTPTLQSSVSDTVTVSAGDSANRSYTYDLAASMSTTFTSITAGETSKGWLSAEYSTSGPPAGVHERPSATLLNRTTSLNSGQTGGFFPFVSGYQVWAGDCDGNDPSKYVTNFFTANPTATVMPSPGVNTPAIAYTKRATVTVTGNTTILNTRQPRFVIKPSTTYTVGGTTPMAGCTEKLPMTGGNPVPGVAGGQREGTATGCTVVARQSTCNFIDMPFGVYDICVDDNNGTSSVRKTITAYANTPAGSSSPVPTTGIQTVNLTTTGASGIISARSNGACPA